MKTYPFMTLIADDSEDDRLLFSRAVRSLPGYRLANVTTDGVQTVMYLKGVSPYDNREIYPFPQLVLLDCQMPGYSGLEVLASMRNLGTRPRVVLWTDAIKLVNQQRAYELGATMVCQKPMSSNHIQNILKAIEVWPLTATNTASGWNGQGHRRNHATPPSTWFALPQTAV